MRLTIVCLSLLCGFLNVAAIVEEIPENITLESLIEMLQPEEKPSNINYNSDINLNTVNSHFFTLKLKIEIFVIINNFTYNF